MINIWHSQIFGTDKVNPFNVIKQTEETAVSHRLGFCLDFVVTRGPCSRNNVRDGWSLAEANDAITEFARKSLIQLRPSSSELQHFEQFYQL